LYVAACLVLAALAIIPTDPNPVAFYALFVVMLPISLAGALVQYFGGILIFGLEQDGLVPRGASFVLWVTLAIVQMLTVRAVRRSMRGTGDESHRVD
jgi:hypothetical protein